VSDRIAIRRALVSVYDKTGLDDLVRGLALAGVELVSTGGSAARIESLGLPVTKVEDLTGFPECLDGRVKTLHPKVHAGILADRRLESHVQQLADLGVEPFDLVVSNLYPFVQTVTSGASPDECVEQIDIGGPTMVRAAAKNHPSVAIVTSPAAYPAVLAALEDGGFTLEERKRLGHWEGDTVMGSDMRHCVLTLVERKSGFAIIKKLKARTKDEVTRAATRAIRKHCRRFKTITFDNGTEFHDYRLLEERFPVKVYFATPYHSWERGSNENFNGLLRQYLPKGTCMSSVTQAQCDHIVDDLNNRPRKRLGFNTPADLYHRH